MDFIRIGTRKSPLAIIQAERVKRELENLGLASTIVPIDSHADLNLKQPLYKMNIIGVFTKDLDIALLNNKIDIAVHSLKDVPTILPKNIAITAVLERDSEKDVLIKNPNKNFKDLSFCKNIATGSLRRKAFWKNKFPETNFFNLRGNIQTRFDKIISENYDGAIFSLAAIKRLKLNVEYENLDFIIPAPSQGAIAISSIDSNENLKSILSQINHKPTFVCTKIERDFLYTLEGGCTAPIGAFAKIINENLIFNSGIISLDAQKKIFLNKTTLLTDLKENQGEIYAKNLISLGAKEILKEFKKIYTI